MEAGMIHDEQIASSHIPHLSRRLVTNPNDLPHSLHPYNLHPNVRYESKDPFRERN
jgi:hypothetical protein